MINDNQKMQVFDKLIFATHADQIIKLLDKPTTDEEIKFLSNFQYTKNKAYLHSDTEFNAKKKISLV